MDSDDEDLDNNPVVRLGNASAGILSVVMSLASAALYRDTGEHVTPSELDGAVDAMLAAARSEPLWARYCEAVPVGERKRGMLGVLGELVRLAPLVELPNVRAPKQMLRGTMASARELERLIAVWDEGTEPTAEMTSAAIAVLDAMRSAPPGEAP